MEAAAAEVRGSWAAEPVVAVATHRALVAAAAVVGAEEPEMAANPEWEAVSEWYSAAVPDPKDPARDPAQRHAARCQGTNQ